MQLFFIREINQRYLTESKNTKMLTFTNKKTVILDVLALLHVLLQLSYLPAVVFSSSSSSLSDAKKGTVAKSSSSALMRPTTWNPWILQSIPELRHCLIATSMYLWNWKETHELFNSTLANNSKLMSRFTNLSTISKEKNCSVCGIDGNCLELS